MIHMDFETRSSGSLKALGAHAYAALPSTEPMCLAFAFDDQPVQLWHPFDLPGVPPPSDTRELQRRCASGEEVWAHNVEFERVIWAHKMIPRGWPEIPEAAWRCTAALSSVNGLPRQLEAVAKALDLQAKKDMEGHRLMQHMSKPARKGGWDEDSEHLVRLFRYCIQDVVVEREVHRRLRPMRPAELSLWQLDQRINGRGVFCDLPLARSAVKHFDALLARLEPELEVLTEGRVTSVNQVLAITSWLTQRGHPIPDVAAETVTWALGLSSIAADPPARRVLEIRQLAGKSSVRKYAAMLTRADLKDSRLRGLYVFHRASTGRWAGTGPQPQNFPRGGLRFRLDIDPLCEAITTFPTPLLETCMGDLAGALSTATRGALRAAPGKTFIAGDLSAIEARVLCWLAGDQDGLAIYRRGLDAYKHAAARLYRIPYEQVTKAQRQEGKAIVLGLGFQMGWERYIDQAATYGVRVEEGRAREVVEFFRTELHPKIPALWREVERTALLAMMHPEVIVQCGPLQWAYLPHGHFPALFMRLPSERPLTYPFPRVERKQNRWGHFKDTLSYRSEKQGGFHRLDTYGGKLVENATQAVARDVMARAMAPLEERGYWIVLHSHDEIVAEVPEGFGSVQELCGVLATPPPWAPDCPLEAAGWTGARYRKD